MVHIGDWMINRLEKLEKSFERILDRGFEPENKFYDYLNDLNIIANNLKNGT